MICGIISKIGRQPNRITSLSKTSHALPSIIVRSFSASDDEETNYIAEDFLEEDITTNEGEWIDCSRKFMAPLKIPGRGSGKIEIFLLNNAKMNEFTYLLPSFTSSPFDN